MADDRRQGEDRRKAHGTRSRVDTLVEEVIPQWRVELEGWQRVVERRQRVALRALAAVAALLLLGFVFVAVAGWSLYDRTSEEALARALAAETGNRQVQRERARALVLTCHETNEQNRAARDAVGDLPPSSRRIAILFVNALAPYREDCEAYAQSRVDVDGG